MVDIDEDTQQALLLFNRRAEAEKQAVAAAKRLAKAESAKDEASEAVKRARGGEELAAAETTWREAVQAWQDIRDGKEPAAEDAPDEPEAEEDDEPEPDAEDSGDEEE